MLNTLSSNPESAPLSMFDCAPASPTQLAEKQTDGSVREVAEAVGENVTVPAERTAGSGKPKQSVRDRVAPKRHQPSSIDLLVLSLVEFFKSLGSDQADELAMRFVEHFAGTLMSVPSDPAPAMLRTGMKAAEIVAKYPHVTERSEPLGPQNYEGRLDHLARFLGENPREIEKQGRRYRELWGKTETLKITA